MVVAVCKICDYYDLQVYIFMEPWFQWIILLLLYLLPHLFNKAAVGPPIEGPTEPTRNKPFWFGLVRLLANLGTFFGWAFFRTPGCNRWELSPKVNSSQG